MMTARDLLSTRVVTGTPEERLLNAATRMQKCAAHHCAVLDATQRFVGLITLSDVASRSFAGNRILADLVCSVPPLMVFGDAPAAEVATLFEKHRLFEAVVLDSDDRYVGLILAENVLNWLWQEHQGAHQELQVLLSERERLSELLEKKVEQRTAELRAVVGEFKDASISLSHDVRSPLRSIQQLADDLARGSVGALTPDGVFGTQSIKRSARKLELIADEILEKAQRVFAAKAPTWETIDLNSVLDDAMVFHRVLMGEHKAVVSKRGKLHIVSGRYVPLLQIVANLLANAIKYVPDGRQPMIEVWTEESPDRVALCIKDNGRGLEQSDRTFIFEPFVRIDGSQRPGLGLGLAIARTAVIEVEGIIGVESEMGVGTLFTVSLKKPAPAEPKGSAASLGS